MPQTTRVRRSGLAHAACFLALAAFAPGARGQYAFTPLYEFSQDGQDGTSPETTLVADASGNLFGTTLGGGPNNAGTVFELVNNSGSYTLQTLYTFTGGSDGGTLYGGPAIDASGNLFGVAQLGGAHNAGTAWELKNNGGSYVFVLLAAFNGGINGEKPMGTLVLDSGGNLYGTTKYGGQGTALVSVGSGTVFELVNNGDGTYTLNTLYRFTGGGDGEAPYAGVVSDANGNLFGTTGTGGSQGSGTVFELANNGGGAYTFNTLYSFSLLGDGHPLATVTLDATGNLFGTTSGAVFELVNTSGIYTEKVLYRFNFYSGDGYRPNAPVLIDSQGNVFGTTEVGGSSGCGTVYELANTSGIYTEGILYNFTGGADGCNPVYGGLYMDSSGNLFGASSTGGSSSNPGGALWELQIQVKTSLNLTSSANPIFTGDNVTFTASISASRASTPIAGTVTFSEGSTVLGTAAVSNQTASLTVSSDALGVGSDTITAQFVSGLNTVLGSSGSMTETVYPNSDVALINGGNTFNGNQTVNGALNATSFIGNGAGLSNVTAAGLACAGCITNFQLGINYAGSNTQGGGALNALALGGMPSTAFAITGSNSFTGDQIVNGKITATGAVSGTAASFTSSLTIGGGTPITQYRSVAQSFTLPAVKSRQCATLQTAPLSGFTPGTADTFALGLPTSFQSNLSAGKVFLSYQVWETSSSPNTTLTIQICNPTGTNYAAAGTTGTIRIDVFKH